MSGAIVFNEAALGALIALLTVVAIFLVRHRRRRLRIYVIGQQMAAAMKHEQGRLASGVAIPSPLPQEVYVAKPGEWGLLTPIKSELDDKLRRTCRDFRSLSAEGRAAFTSSVSLDEFYTLISFAQRAAVFALRNKDAELVRDGLTALAVIEAKRVDFRDILVALAVLHHGASRTGGDFVVLVREAANIAEPEVAQLMIAFAGKDAGYSNLKESWGYAEVETGDGPGLVRWGSYAYAPKADLLDVAMKLALIFDADAYLTSSIELATELPLVWLRTSRSEPPGSVQSGVRACATLQARLRDDKHANASVQQFTVFLADMESAESAHTLGNLARSTRPDGFARLAVDADCILCLVIARSFMQGINSFESGDSLDRFRPQIQAALSGVD